MDAQRRESVARFAELAAEDLHVARLCLAGDPPAHRPASFHAQQAAEKYLKAWLVALGVDEPPLTHDLVELARRLAARGAPSLAEEPLRFLTRFAVRPRYGLEHRTPGEAGRAIAEAARIEGTVASALEAWAAPGAE